MMNINEVQKRIKQRPPFQMIEKVIEIRGGEYAKGIKNVSINEPYFMGHFPDAPIMPGVLIVEACAQLCSVTIESDGTDDSKIYVLLKCDEFKFVKPVLPGDTLTIEVTKDGGGAGLVKFDCKAMVDGELRAKGKLAFCAVDRANIYG
ncbi:MAG: 3-hydroxyacyl-ACP dehydratase FabZ [Lachnospiraceae bacterium]|jgi:3-hydroxyacyl-[acyl-carrier-protein] dehydratase|nr:3-hydroxyacyl-ACP dehydratase FabZ [Lachnospiraceae bacterium]MBP5275568.1 3-hydroxyacyl-ACP dehydratase FabZ [Lachnospiraceae bacterium]MBP5564582.1 3-hydroxyacyl-ACP dehydratase FabZ [Lachnospiraceae bacterium]MBQ4274989.1 3-hydroxyacyl-ACP dehydratase FabZ [Lachnospiraceae bacterium]MCR4695785.1 3-hydroxyacyl-ACP dehydratase FabZ [Lachnospiraceae bacterium]